MGVRLTVIENQTLSLSCVAKGDLCGEIDYNYINSGSAIGDADVDIDNAKVDDCFAIDGWEHPQRSSKIRCNYDELEDVDVDDVDDVDDDEDGDIDDDDDSC